MELLATLAVFVFFGLIGAYILAEYQKGGTGFLVGCLLGPIGVMLALFEKRKLQRSTERECPSCASRILRKAKVCKHCGRDVDVDMPPWEPGSR